MSSERDERTDRAIAEYLAACDAGSPPDRGAFLARYPDLAESLGEFLDDHDRMKGAAPPDPDATRPQATRPPAAGDTATLPPSPGEHPPAPHERVRYFGDYELLSEIARGGMGVVFRARQVSLNREVALKMILSAQLASASDVQRFRLEAEAAANLDHPNVLPIHEVGEHDGQQYFSMKLVSGGSLADRLAASPRPPVRELVALLAEVCRAVHFAHQRGVLHRDLKPGNVLIDSDGTPFVTDFGLAKRVGREDSGLTRTGAVVGTPSYMAPEQARAEKGVSTATDVYSLGAILYEIITGRPPFRGPTVMDTLLQVLEQDPADPRSTDPRADRDLSLVALKCLEKTPARRYEHAAALADDLERWLRGEAVGVRRAGRLERLAKWARRKPTLAAAYGLTAFSLVLAGLVAGAVWLWQRAEHNRLDAETARDQFAGEKKVAEGARDAADKARQGEASARADAERERDKLTRIGYGRNIRFAQSYVVRADPWRAEGFLAATPPGLRGWEYGYLLGCCREWHVHFAGGPVDFRPDSWIAPGDASSAAFSHDGSRIVCARGSSPVRILDATTWATLAELDGHSSPVRWAAFGPDGSKIVTACRDGTAHVWDATARRPILTFQMADYNLLRGPSFSPDGSRILGNGPHDDSSCVWDARTGNVLLELAGQDAA